MRYYKIRDVKKVDDFYRVFKPLEHSPDVDGVGWENHGKIYTRRGLVNLLETNTEIKFHLSDEIKQDIEKHQQECLERKQKYLDFRSNPENKEFSKMFCY